MSEQDSRPPRADRTIETLARLGATHLLGVPDSGTAPLLDRSRTAPAGMSSLTVTREGEAFAIASGLWLGGARPVVVIQNTGLLESGDALRGTAMRMGVPLLCLIGYRGRASLERAGGLIDRATLTDAEIDSAALLTEPTLETWGVPFSRIGASTDLPLLVRAWERAWSEERPVAVLLERGLA